MAKKKEKETDAIETQPKSGLSFDELIKQFSGVLKEGKSILENRPMVIPVSPVIDVGFNGGITDGSFSIFAGPPKLGKTTTCLHIAANAQKLKYALPNYPEGRHVFYANIEGRLKPRDIEGCKHLDLNRFTIIGSTPTDKETQGKILSAQEYLTIVEGVIHRYPGCIVIIDSFTELVTEEEMNSGMDEMQRAIGPKLLYKFCRKVANVVPVNRNIVLGVVHMQSNVSGYGSPFSESSGNALKFKVDFKLLGKTFKEIKVGEEQPTGQEVSWKVGCSGIGSPGMNITSYIRYGDGIDCARELLELASSIGIIEKKGSWFNINGESIQGAEKARQYLVDNPETYNKAYKEVRELMGLKS